MSPVVAKQISNAKIINSQVCCAQISLKAGSFY